MTIWQVISGFFSSKTGLFALILAIFLGFIGLVASLIEIASAYKTPGLVISIVLAFIIAILCFLRLRNVLVKNSRGVTMLDAITTVGLVDVENRALEERHVPHPTFYSYAEREIAVTAMTAYTTFSQHRDLILQYLENGKKIYIMILHPDSRDIPELQGRNKVNIKEEIESTIRTIVKNKLHQQPGFQLRFMTRMPPFTAVMLDGDLVQTGERPDDRQGQIRIQPQTAHGTQHRGIILQLKRLTHQSSKKNAFSYFAEDLRRQWREDGKTHPELFDRFR